MAYRNVRSSSPSAPRQRLHYFTLPGVNWGATKHLRCMKVNPNSRIIMHPSLSSPVADQTEEAQNELTHLEKNQEFAASPEKKSGFMEDPMEVLQRGCEEMRVSEMNETRKGKEKVYEDDGNETRKGKEKVSEDDGDETRKGKEKVSEDDGNETRKGKEKVSEDDGNEIRPGGGAWTWNLRTRRSASKAPRGKDGGDVKVDVPAEVVGGSAGGGGGGSGGVSSPTEKSDNRLRGGGLMASGVEPKMEFPKFSFTLTKEEIEHDFLLMTGAKPPAKPKRRPKRLQKKLNDLVPGTWLGDVTPETYKVDEKKSKKGFK